MSTSGCVDAPASVVTVERGVRREGHDQINFAIRVHMVRADDIFHLDHVNRKAVRCFGRFDDAPKLDSARLAVTYQARSSACSAGIEQAAIGRAHRRQFVIEPSLNLRVEIATQKRSANIRQSLPDGRQRMQQIMDPRDHAGSSQCIYNIESYCMRRKGVKYDSTLFIMN